MSTQTILFVDDEPAIQRATATLLRSRGYSVLLAGTGAEGLASFDRHRPNLVIVDLGLPDMDGIAVCRQLRARADVPIVVLSVRGEETSKVHALDAGADDYVTKPFGPEELLARIRVGLRRSAGEDLHGRVARADLVIDFDKRRLYRGDLEIRLTPREFGLLTLLAGNAGRVLTHQTIAKRLWGASGAAQHEHLRVLVGQLRKKLELNPEQPKYVITEPWVGYRFAAEPG
jgi:two-component system, OmpR family, KDP operon response regulator KdpE